MHDLSLVPHAEQYYNAGLNVLLISDHGVGKTSLVVGLASKLGISMKYFSAATMDPFTDLVGVPFPKETTEKNDAGEPIRVLEMVRPREVDEAELIFFDELNRADPRVLDAVFELIQFRSINGEKLPKLKAVWAAINPPNSDKDYEVDTLDPALIDRFDVYEELRPKPSIQYLKQQMGFDVAEVLVNWWKDHEKGKRGSNSYISPRRLEKIGAAVIKLGTANVVRKLLPPGGNYDWKTLENNLTEALIGKTLLRYDLDWLKDNINTFRRASRNAPDSIDFVKLSDLYTRKADNSVFADPVHQEILATVPNSFLENTLYVKKKKAMRMLAKNFPETKIGQNALKYFTAKGVKITPVRREEKLFLNASDAKEIIANAVKDGKTAAETCRVNPKVREAVANALVKARVSDVDIVLHLAPVFDVFTQNEIDEIIRHWNGSKMSTIRVMLRDPLRVRDKRPGLTPGDVNHVTNKNYATALKKALGV